MPWKRMLAYVTGEIEESLLLRIEYLIEENRVCRNQLGKRILLTDAERKALAEKAVALGKLMADTVTIVKPETILKWHRRSSPGSSTAPSTARSTVDLRSVPRSRHWSCGWRRKTRTGVTTVSPAPSEI